MLRWKDFQSDERKFKHIHNATQHQATNKRKCELYLFCLTVLAGATGTMFISGNGDRVETFSLWSMTDTTNGLHTVSIGDWSGTFYFNRKNNDSVIEPTECQDTRTRNWTSRATFKAIFRPRNKWLIWYMLFSKIVLINMNTGSIVLPLNLFMEFILSNHWIQYSIWTKGLSIATNPSKKGSNSSQKWHWMDAEQNGWFSDSSYLFPYSVPFETKVRIARTEIHSILHLG